MALVCNKCLEEKTIEGMHYINSKDRGTCNQCHRISKQKRDYARRALVAPDKFIKCVTCDGYNLKYTRGGKVLEKAIDKTKYLRSHCHYCGEDLCECVGLSHDDDCIHWEMPL